VANIKSAKKRALVAERNRLRNRAVRSRVKTAIKRFEMSDQDVQVAFRRAVSQIDKAVTKGVLHRNAAARRKSALSKKLAARAGT